MIKKRLVGLLSHAKKYIAANVLWQWAALLVQVVAVFTVAGLLNGALDILVGGNGTMQGGTAVGRSLVVLAICVALRFLFEKLASAASYKASVDVKRILRQKIYGKMLALGVSYREKVSTSEVMQVSTEGVEQLETYFGKYLPQLFYSLLAPVTLFLILCHVSMKASVVLLICVPLIPLSIVAVQKIAKRLLNKYWSVYTGLGDSFLENLQGLTTLKIYQADELKAGEMDKEAEHFRRITMKVLTMQLNSTSVMDIVAYGGAAAGMIVTLSEFLAGRIDFAGTVAIVLLASEFFIPLRLLGSFFHIAMNGMAASDKIFAILDIPEDEDGKAAPHWEKAPGISVKDLHFSYEKDREILKGISLEIPAGSFVSLVGESGCGKSTLAGILSGRNKGFTGSVRIGGIPLEEISAAALMKEVTVVRHNSYLFKGTVAENLQMAKPDATTKQMREVLRRTKLLEFLDTQQGLATPLLEQVGNLSGGQKQRLALARALLKDSPVYIFDEATSNIDVESEELIMEVIRELAKTKTVILISHRLANVVGSDRIYLLENGKIQESGTHEELLANSQNSVEHADNANHHGYGALYWHQAELESYGEKCAKAARKGGMTNDR